MVPVLMVVILQPTQDLPWPMMAGPRNLHSRAGAGFGSARGSLSPPVPLAGAVPGSWVPRAPGAEPAQGGVMLIVLPSPRRSRCHSASSAGHGRQRLCHGHLPRAAAGTTGTGAAPAPGAAREGAQGMGWGARTTPVLREGATAGPLSLGQPCRGPHLLQVPQGCGANLGAAALPRSSAGAGGRG